MQALETNLFIYFQNKSQNAQHPKLLGISITRGLYLIEINLNLNWWLKS